LQNVPLQNPQHQNPLWLPPPSHAFKQRRNELSAELLANQCQPLNQQYILTHNPRPRHQRQNAWFVVLFKNLHPHQPLKRLSDALFASNLRLAPVAQGSVQCTQAKVLAWP